MKKGQKLKPEPRQVETPTQSESTPPIQIQTIDNRGAMQIGGKQKNYFGSVTVIQPPNFEALLEAPRKLKKSFEESTDVTRFDCYVRPSGEKQIGSSESFCVFEEIDRFLETPYQRSLLILGDSGTGKSLLGIYIAWQFWERYQPGKRVPLFIHLPVIAQEKRVGELLQAYLESEGLESQQISKVKKEPLLLILDGYDEIPEVGNLYLQNHWHTLNVKIITTCRPEALLKRQVGYSYQELFLPKKTELNSAQKCFVEFYLKKFTLEQIYLYLQKFVQSHNKKLAEKDQKDWEKDYKEPLEAVSGLLELVENPFILSMVVRVLPQIVAKYKSDEMHEKRQLVRADIYDCFIDDWLNHQVERLQEQGNLKSLKGSLKSYLKIYSQNLAYRALRAGQLEITVKEQDTLDPCLLQSEDETLLAQYHEDASRVTPEAMAYIRSGCLLKTGKSYFSFLHKSLVEYFAAQDLFLGAHLTVDSHASELLAGQLTKRFGMNEGLLTNEPSIVHILADKARMDADFKKLLYGIIDFSKQQPLISTAAANAITILNVAGESFSAISSPISFKGVHIPGANLSGGICDQTDFSDAHLEGARFDHAWLRGAKFERAHMKDVYFSELPSIEYSQTITSMGIDPKGNWLLIADIKGNITKWSLESGKIDSRYSVSPYGKDLKLGAFFGFLPISGLTISSDGQLAAFGTFDAVVHLWDLKKGKPIKQLVTQEAQLRDPICAKRIHKILFTPDATRIIFGGQVDLQMWNVETAEFICGFKDGYGYDLTVSPDGEWLFSGGYDKLYSYNLKNLVISSDRKALSTSTFYIKVRDIEFSPTGKWLGVIQGGYDEDGSVELWDAVTLSVIRTFQLPGVKPIDLNFSPDEQLLVTTSYDGFQVWHIESGKYLYNLVFPSSTNTGTNIPRQKIIFSPTNQRHAYYSVDNKVHVWFIQTTPNFLARSYYPDALDLVEQGIRAQSSTHKTSSVLSIDGDLQVEANIDGKTGFLKVTRNHKICYMSQFVTKGNQNFAGEEIGLLLGPNERYVVFSYMDTYGFEMVQGMPAASLVKRISPLGADTDIRIWDLQKEELIYIVKHHNQIICMIFSSDSEWLITAGYTVRIWDTHTGRCIDKYNEHSSWTDAIALTTNKQFLAIADGAKSLSLWDTKAHRRICLISEFSVRIKQLAFSKDSTHLVAHTKRGDELLFRFDSHGSKLNLVNRTGLLNLNCVGADLTGTYELGKEKEQLLKQRGAIGTPSKKTAAAVPILHSFDANKKRAADVNQYVKPATTEGNFPDSTSMNPKFSRP